MVIETVSEAPVSQRGNVQETKQATRLLKELVYPGKLVSGST
jgi:hypothetical protein